MHIVLLEPEIPANTGNIGRTCVCSNTALHLIRPLGFSIDEKAVKRAGLDYWSELEITVHDSFGDFSKAFGITPDSDAPRLFMATTKALNVYSDVSYKENDFIMFGKESAGIPDEILLQHRSRCIRIPMVANHRSLNLSNSVSIVLYEALRQNGFAGMRLSGQLHRSSWGMDV